MERKRTINQYDFARQLSDEALEDVISAARPIHMIAGSTVVRAGQSYDDVLLLGSGQIRVFLNNENGREVTLYLLNPGQLCLVNFLSATSGVTTPQVNAKTTMDSEGVLLAGKDFRQLMRKHESLQTLLLLAISDRVNHLFKAIEQLCFVKLETRLANYLLSQSEPTLDHSQIKRTHAEIAADLGSVREAITRTLKQFTQMGAIDTQRRTIEITNVDLLRQIK